MKQDKWWKSRFCVLPFLGIGTLTTMAILSGLVLSSPYWASDLDFNIGLILTCNSTKCDHTWQHLPHSDFVVDTIVIEATSIAFNSLAALTGLFYVCKRPDVTGWLTASIVLGFMGGVFSLVSAWHFASTLPPVYTKEWAWYVAICIGILGPFQVAPLVILRVTVSKTLGTVKPHLITVKSNLDRVKTNFGTLDTEKQVNTARNLELNQNAVTSEKEYTDDKGTQTSVYAIKQNLQNATRKPWRF